MLEAVRIVNDVPLLASVMAPAGAPGHDTTDDRTLFPHWMSPVACWSEGMATSSNSAPEDTEQVLAVCAEETERTITCPEGTDLRSQLISLVWLVGTWSVVFGISSLSLANRLHEIGVALPKSAAALGCQLAGNRIFSLRPLMVSSM